MKVLKRIEGQGYFLTLFFHVFMFCALTRPRYQVSLYRNIGPLVLIFVFFFHFFSISVPHSFVIHLAISINDISGIALSIVLKFCVFVYHD